MLNLTQLHEIAERDRETYREMMKSEREHIAKLEEIKNSTTRPDETVRLFVEAVGYSDAVETVANLVNRYSWDGRISRINAAWSGAYAGLAEDAMVDKGLYTSIHMVHLDQIAEEMRLFVPDDADDEETMTEDQVVEQVEQLPDEELVEAWNTCCENGNDPDSMIFSMDDFEEITGGIGKYELLRMAFYGTFNPNDDWFGFNGYGNLVSFGYEARLCDRIDAREIAKDYLEDPTPYKYTALGEDLS